VGVLRRADSVFHIANRRSSVPTMFLQRGTCVNRGGRRRWKRGRSGAGCPQGGRPGPGDAV